MRRIPVVDVFAGPGGLGEGFCSFRGEAGKPAFDIRLSVEKDPPAHATLKLRTFFRELCSNNPYALDSYYDFLRQGISLGDLYGKHPLSAAVADRKAWLAELGGARVPQTLVRERIIQALDGADDFVLIGGPPCQAYSIAGRARNRGIPGYDPKADKRQVLYVEYLRILADHQPVAFVMENVKGLLSATLDNQGMFGRIMSDLRQPRAALGLGGAKVGSAARGYRLYSFIEAGEHTDSTPRDFLVRAEHYGIPQARHRVIVLGIREDLGSAHPSILRKRPLVPIEDVIESLPRLRSGLSRTKDSPAAWRQAIEAMQERGWFSGGVNQAAGDDVAAALRKALNTLRYPKRDRGAMFLKTNKGTPAYRADWFMDRRIKGVCNHESRMHIQEDLHRYFYCACYALARSQTPMLCDFPKKLLPDHRNVRELVASTTNTADAQECLHNTAFHDRFRVQVWGKPATTVTSHIAKDGHYYVHPDPTQCRSLTVREAARVQTFPDNYYFCGNRTSQYQQVGNAVPPLLALQLAAVVHGALMQSGMNAQQEELVGSTETGAR